MQIKLTADAVTQAQLGLSWRMRRWNAGRRSHRPL